MDIIKTRFEEHIALAQLVAQSEIMQQVADAAAMRSRRTLALVTSTPQRSQILPL